MPCEREALSLSPGLAAHFSQWCDLVIFCVFFLFPENTTKMISLVTGRERTVPASDVTLLTSKSSGQGPTLVRYQKPSRQPTGAYPVLLTSLTAVDKELAQTSVPSEIVASVPKPTVTSAAKSTAISDDGNKLGAHQYIDQSEGQIVLPSSDSVDLASDGMVHVFVQAADNGEQVTTAVSRAGVKIETVADEVQVPVVSQIQESMSVLQEKENIGKCAFYMLDMLLSSKIHLFVNLKL